MILENEIFLLIDKTGGQCDKIALGGKGLVNCANISAEAFNEYIDDEDREQGVKEIEEVKEGNLEELGRAFSILEEDNYEPVIVGDKPILVNDVLIVRSIDVKKDNPNLTVIDVTNLEFDENNIYRIY